MALASTELRVPLPKADEEPDLTYTVQEGRLIWMRHSAGSVIPTPLSNFDARIISDIVEDYGFEERRSLEIRAVLDSRTHEFKIPASKFKPMNWVIEHLGAGALLYPGHGRADHARAAIQELSKDIERRTDFRHIGWRKIDGSYVYLHGNGAIGAGGVSEELE